MKLTRFAVTRPIAMTMILCALCLLGAVSYTQLAVKRLPDVSYPKVSVSVSYPGGGADNVRTEVLDPIQNALSGIGGIDNLQSTSSSGKGKITIRFVSGTDMDQKAAEVAHAIDAMSGTLPTEVPEPTVIKADPDAAPILSIAVTGDKSRSELYNWVTGTLQPELSHIPGVATVTLTGARQPQINIDVKPDRLLQYGVTLADISAAIGDDKTSTPGGATNADGRSLSVVTEGTIDSVADFGNVVVSGSNGKQIRLNQLADISLGYAPIETQSFWNGKPAMSLYIYAQSTANSLEVSNGVRRTVDDMKASVPEGTELRILGDLTVFTRHALSAVETDLFIAILAAAIVLALFLKRLKQTFIVMLAIPASLMLTGLVMYALHFSLDIISLLAMSLLIGILIDDAIVVLENIDRHRRMGKKAVQAAVDGRTEIGWAAIAITLTDVVVYAPVAFMSGNVGQLFREFGLVIVAASLFSLVVSFTLTPMMAAHWLKGSSRKTVTASDETHGATEASASVVPPSGNSAGAHLETAAGSEADSQTSRIYRLYDGVQTYFVRHWYWSLIIIGLCGTFIWGSFQRGWVPTTFTPDENAGVFAVNVQLPNGTSQDITNQAVSRLADGIRSIPTVAGVLATTGFGDGSASGSNVGRMTVELKSDAGLHGTAETMANVSELAKEIPGIKIQTSTANPLLQESGGTLHAVLSGPDMTVLSKLADQFQTLLQSTPGLTNIQSTAEPSTPQWSIRPNERASTLYGLDARTVGQAIRTAIQGSQMGPFVPAGALQGQPVVLELTGGSTMDVQQLQNIPIARYQDRLVTLGQVATIDKTGTPQKILEDDRQLQISLTANINDSSVGNIAKQLQQKARQIGMPAGYSFKLSGAAEQQSKAFGPMLSALMLSIGLMYMLLAALYESFLDPLVVIIMLPFAAAGGLLMLSVTGTPFSIYAFIAMIMLMGLVAKNAILLIDYAKSFLKMGLGPREALLRAGRVRLRPIMMTTITMVFAMLPLALPFGTGSSDRMPIALVLIGGMSLSTLLTLLVLPTCYTYLWLLQNWLIRLLPRRRRKAPGSAAPDTVSPS